MTGTQTIQISEATYQALMEEIRLRGVTLEEFLKSFLLANGHSEKNEAGAVKDFGAYLLEKHEREKQRFAALQHIAAQQGIPPGEWVRRHFPQGRDNQGRLLSEALDAFILDQNSKSPG
jgi:hypothetical protein